MQLYCTVQSEVIGSSAGCTVWQQQRGRTCDTSPWWCINLLLKELPSAEIVSCRGRDSCTSSNDSLSIILLSPTTCTDQFAIIKTFFCIAQSSCLWLFCAYAVWLVPVVMVSPQIHFLQCSFNSKYFHLKGTLHLRLFWSGYWSLIPGWCPV